MVDIDGTPYALRDVDALPIDQIALLQIGHEQITAYLAHGADAGVTEAQVASRLQDLTAIVLEAPVSVLASLTTTQRLLLYGAYVDAQVARGLWRGPVIH